MITESSGGKCMSLGGRGVWNRKMRVDEVRSIDVLELQHKGVFSKGWSWSWTTSWSRNGEVVGSVAYRLESGVNGPVGLRFMYTITSNETGEKKNYNYIIPVVTTLCNYGGKRWWFICPLVVNGRSCRRRCRMVYLPPAAEYFGCRECHGLTYESRQRHREKFYEGLEQPYKAVVAAQRELARAKSWDKKEKLFRDLSQAYAAIENFEKILTRPRRIPNIRYKEK
jgi:hypothetical protein